MAPMEYLWAWGTLIHEKNLKSKISCQTPFKSLKILSLPRLASHLVGALSLTPDLKDMSSNSQCCGNFLH
jgi:hypothetical protein